MLRQIISLVNHKGVGIGDQMVVRRGYARYLIANNQAVADTKENREKFEKRRMEFEQKATDALKQAKESAEKLVSLTVTLSSRAADESRLYGSIGAKELAQAITEAGVLVEKRQIHLPEGPIRHVGEHVVEVHLHQKVTQKVSIKVIPTTQR